MTIEATLVSFADVKSMVYDGDVHNEIEISLINQLSYLGGTTLYMGNKFFGGNDTETFVIYAYKSTEIIPPSLSMLSLA